MIYGIGIDLIETDRIKKQLKKHGDRFYEKICTDDEVEYCMRSSSINVRAQRFAGRFAAKEAFLKAVGTGLRNGLQWKDIEIVNDELGRPTIILKNKALQIVTDKHVNNVHISISHSAEYASAVVVLET